MAARPSASARRWPAGPGSKAMPSNRPRFEPDGETASSDPMLLYFTSGTTAQPKLVLHSHLTYPVGHLSTLYWLGLRPGDVHLNISSPGWAKHAWSCVFAPWLGEACVLILDQPRFDAKTTLDALVGEAVTSFCAPPTVWRMLDPGGLRRPGRPPCARRWGPVSRSIPR